MKEEVTQALNEGRLCWCGSCTGDDSLMELWHAIYLHPVTCAKMLFPEHPKGYVTTTRTLGNIAANLHAARACAAREEKQGAACYYGIVAGLMRSLPDYAKPVGRAILTQKTLSWSTIFMATLM